MEDFSDEFLENMPKDQFDQLWGHFGKPLLFTGPITTTSILKVKTGWGQSIILSPFLRDESLAREANEFGY